MKRLARRGYELLLDYYLKVSPQFNPASAGLYTRTAWFTLTKEGYSGVSRRDGYARRRTSSVNAGGAVYSIRCCPSCPSAYNACQYNPLLVLVSVLKSPYNDYERQ